MSLKYEDVFLKKLILITFVFLQNRLDDKLYYELLQIITTLKIMHVLRVLEALSHVKKTTEKLILFF